MRAQGFLAPYQQRAYWGWVGTVMLVDYETSPVGPYQELLFVPGLFRFGDTTSFSIAKIYVSTRASVWNGRQNWGIPKELAHFSFVLNSDGSRTISVRWGVTPLVAGYSLGPSLPNHDQTRARLSRGAGTINGQWFRS
ncbi:acetoacetate decarboxylase family protein [Spirosoma arcticum]